VRKWSAECPTNAAITKGALASSTEEDPTLALVVPAPDVVGGNESDAAKISRLTGERDLAYGRISALLGQVAATISSLTVFEEYAALTVHLTMTLDELRILIAPVCNDQNYGWDWNVIHLMITPLTPEVFCNPGENLSPMDLEGWISNACYNAIFDSNAAAISLCQGSPYGPSVSTVNCVATGPLTTVATGPLITATVEFLKDLIAKICASQVRFDQLAYGLCMLSTTGAYDSVEELVISIITPFCSVYDDPGWIFESADVENLCFYSGPSISVVSMEDGTEPIIPLTTVLTVDSLEDLSMEDGFEPLP
jgi:hypothetical protein